MEQFNLKMTLRHQNIDNTITSFVLCYIIFVNQSKLDRIRYTFQKTASVNDIPKCGRFYSLSFSKHRHITITYRTLIRILKIGRHKKYVTNGNFSRIF